MACICEFAAIPSAERVDAECGERRQQRGETRSQYRPQPCWADPESRPRRIPQRPLSGYLEFIVAARVGKSFTRAPMAERMVAGRKLKIGYLLPSRADSTGARR